jgi:hypothetical protein
MLYSYKYFGGNCCLHPQDRNRIWLNLKWKKGVGAIPLTGIEGLYGCLTLRIPLCIDNRLRDGGNVVRPTYPPHFTPQKHYYLYVSCTHFYWKLSKPQGLVRPKGLGKFKNSPHRVSNSQSSGL